MTSEDREIKTTVADIFDRMTPIYDIAGPPTFSIVGRRLVESAQIHPNATVLDVACGRGAVLLPAAEIVGQSGRVVGIDISPEMMRNIEGEIERLGYKNVQLLLMDAEQLDFPNESFDFVFCSLSLQFFPQYQKALDEFNRVLKPGGHVCISINHNDPLSFITELILKHVMQSRNISSSDFILPQKMGSIMQEIGTPSNMIAILSEKGFNNIRIEEEEIPIIFKNEEQLWSSLWSIFVRYFLEKLEAKAIQDLKNDINLILQDYKQKDGFLLPPMKVFFSLGAKKSG